MNRLMRFALPLPAGLPLVGHADVSGTYIEDQNPSVAVVPIEAPAAARPASIPTGD